ncbi:MAG: efflux RND transporter periplasmic adaptor subunit [Bacteroidota bacterium]
METKNIDLSSLKIDRNKSENVNPDRKKLSYYIGLVIIVVVVLLGLFWGWNALFKTSIEVELTTVTLQSPSQSSAALTASGYVVAQRKAAVASKGTGRLVYLGVVEGDRVKKDEIIARLEDNDIKAQLEQAKANLKLNEADLKDAENNYKRIQELLKTGSATVADVDAAESRYYRVLASIDLAKAQILAAEVAMENTLIRAPFNGTVLTKNADVGEIVAPLAASTSKANVVTIADMNSLQVEADVSESNITKIEPEQDCEIRLDAYPQNAYPGYVAKIVPTADRSKATVMVKVGFKTYDAKVLPEMSAKVVFMKEKLREEQLSEQQILVLPKESVKEIDGSKVVYKVIDKTVTEIPVTTGRDMGSYIEIVSGLENGDRVISKITDEIKDGITVKVK